MLYDFIILIVATISTNVDALSDSEWCNLNCGKTENTMCAYKEVNYTEKCGSISNSMTQETKDDVLHQHNQIRNIVAEGGMRWPKAANMRKLEWDDDLAAVAQRWAFQCDYHSDKCRITQNFTSVGQSSTRGPAFTSIDINSWIYQVRILSPRIVSKYKKKMYATDVTQLLWAETYKVGCGEIVSVISERENSRNLVCNYGPAGNIISQPIYEIGEPCSNCPVGTECDPTSEFPNLCASVQP